MVLLSAWWVKGLVIGGLAGVADLRRRAVPWTFLWATVAGLLAWGLSSLVKDAVDRPRPFADGGIHAVGRLPGGSSFPSGHAATAFAAATVVAILAPRLRVPAHVLAALVAFSRVYLGVHFLSDVLAGAVLGIGVGLLVSAVGPGLARWASARRATGRSAPTHSGAGPRAVAGQGVDRAGRGPDAPDPRRADEGGLSRRPAGARRGGSSRGSETSRAVTRSGT
jgi:membrane-associated phospholipid phosphatase